MKRIIKIEDIGLEGVRIGVTFHGAACLSWPHIKTEYSTLSPGNPTSAMQGRDYFIHVVSPRFKETAEATEWLDELTEEVKSLANLSQVTINSFKVLEGTCEI